MKFMIPREDKSVPYFKILSKKGKDNSVYQFKPQSSMYTKIRDFIFKES